MLRSRLSATTLHRGRLILGVVVVGGALVVQIPGLSATAASARSVSASTARVSSSVKPDFAYYRDKTINWYNFGSAGLGPDLSLRILAPYVAAYLHASVNVIDAPASENLITGQNIPASMPPNGLTIGSLNTLADINDFVDNVPGLSFNVRSVPLLASWPAGTTYVFSYAGLGPTTFKQMVTSTTPITSLSLANSSSTLTEQLIYGAYKVPIKYIYGYASLAAVSQGFARGDGQTTESNLGAIGSLVVARKATVLLATAKAIKGQLDYSAVASVPTLQKFSATDPPKSSDGKKELKFAESLVKLGTIYFLPAGTPAKFTAALNAALIFALARHGAIAQANEVGQTPGVSSPAAEKQGIATAIADQSELSRWLAAAASE